MTKEINVKQILENAHKISLENKSSNSGDMQELQNLKMKDILHEHIKHIMASYVTPGIIGVIILCCGAVVAYNNSISDKIHALNLEIIKIAHHVDKLTYKESLDRKSELDALNIRIAELEKQHKQK